MRPLLFHLCNYRGWNLVISMVAILFLKSCISHYSTPNTVPDPIVTLKSVFIFIHKLFFFHGFKSSSDRPVRKAGSQDPEAELEAGLYLEQKAKTLPQESLQGRELLQDPGFLQNILLGPLRDAEPGGCEERSRKSKNQKQNPQVLTSDRQALQRGPFQTGKDKVSMALRDSTQKLAMPTVTFPVCTSSCISRYRKQVRTKKAWFRPLDEPIGYYMHRRNTVVAREHIGQRERWSQHQNVVASLKQRISL